MIKEALQYLVGLKRPETVEVAGAPYATGSLEPICAEWPKPLGVTTLDALVTYLIEDADRLMLRGNVTEFVVHVESPTQVSLYAAISGPHNQRTMLVRAVPYLPDIMLGRYMPGEDMVVMVQTRFERRGDWDKVVAVAGNVQDGVTREYSDDGVSQQVTVRSGVATKAQVVVPNPVMLAPFRTFPEMQQPISPFLFRAKAGSENEKPTFVLYEADGGAWRIEAIAQTKMWLAEALKDVDGYVTIV